MPVAGLSYRLEETIEERWQAWLLERNRSGTRALMIISGVLYPLFGLTDFLLAPPDALWILLSTRVLVTALAFTLLALVRTSLFDRFRYLYSAGFLVIAGAGISLMTVYIDGLASVYYAGLSLVLVASGLLFVWPVRVIVPTYSAVVGTFLVGNLLVNGLPKDPAHAVANMFFLLSIALLTAVGQVIAYRSLREQIGTQVQVERAGKELQAAHEQLKKLDEHKSKFFQNITHEFKTPLTIVMTPLQNLIQHEGAAAQSLDRPQLQTMYRACMQVLKMVDDLLDLARSEESELHLKVSERDLVPYLSSLVMDSQVIAHRKNIELTFLHGSDGAFVWCDLERLDRVFINLLANAVKFTPEHGKVGVSVWELGDHVYVQVADTGPGFAREFSEKVFERFYQVDGGSTRRYGGTGIGLALARDIVLLHGGTIQADADTGMGATFTVAFRKGNEHFAPELLAREGRGDEVAARGLGGVLMTDPSRYRLLDIETATEKRRLDRDPDEGRHKFSILVVEDNDNVAHALNETLRSDYRVYAASNGEEALKLVASHPPNLIITDYMMPVMDGIELLRRLRENPHTKFLPVVMLSARGDVETKIAGMEMGAHAFIAKPFDTKFLKATVRRLLQEQENVAEALLHKQLDSIEVIISGLAHQINNPLNFVKTAIVVIRRDTAEAFQMARMVDGSGPNPVSAEVLDRRLTRMFDTVDVGIRRIADTVELMRRYSRDGYQRVPEPFPLFEATREVVRLVLPTAQSDIRIESDLAGHGTVDCVADEVNQVLTNLIQNAIDALNSKGGGLVRVMGVTTERDVTLSIRDDGPGIPPENRARLFTPFFSTKGPGSGMGLGLFICHRIVHAMGGSITVNSEVGQGTEMIVRFPASRRPILAAPAAQPSQPAA